MSIWFALILITLCALLWDAGIVLQKLAVDRIPRLRIGRGFGTALRSLIKSGRWLAGLLASAIGWGLFAFALTFTPVSVARAIQGSGFVILAVFSLLFLGHRLLLREWVGVALVTCGIVVLGIAEAQSVSVQGTITIHRLLYALAVCLLACLAAAAVPGLLRIGLPWVIAFSIIAGTLLGLGDVFTKILLTALQERGLGALTFTAGASLIVFYISGFLVLSRAYQHGRAILVTAVSDLCSRLVAIFLGITALGETLSANPRLRILAVVGYTAIIIGAVSLARFSGEEIAEGIASPRVVRAQKESQLPIQPQKGKHASPTQIDTKN
jgi:drug/metabolite transporter (DMT)-like permease